MHFDSGRPFIVGALYSETGPTALVERTQLNATLLAIEEVNAGGGVAGREVVPIAYDACSDPEQFSANAERLLDEDRASLLVGCYMSSCRQAVVPVVERRGAVLAYTAPYEGFEYSPNVVYGGAVPNQHILLLARYLFNNVGKRLYFVGTRYTFPIESNRVMLTLVAEQKGQVLAERYVPLNAQRRELDQIVQDIKRKKPDVVFCTVVGEAASAFYELCAEAGLADQLKIASLTITEAEIGRMPPRVAEGHLTGATYFQSIDTPANRSFVRRYQARFGLHERLNAMAETAYTITHMMLAAAARARSTAIASIRAELVGRPFQAPQGEVKLDPENGHLYLWPRIGCVQADGQFKIVAESQRAIKPDPYLVHHSLEDWAPDSPPVSALVSKA